MTSPKDARSDVNERRTHASPAGHERPSATGREAAGRVLSRVFGEDAWASRALDAELERSRLPVSEAARATDLVYGALRGRVGLDARIEKACKKGLPTEDVVLAALRGAAYELVHTRAESHAVVDGWVGFTKKERGEGLARFANAVLRKLADERPPEPLPPSATFPKWMHSIAESALGKPRATSFFTSLSEAPSLALRVRNDADRAPLIEALRAARPEADLQLGTLSPLAILARGVGDPRRLPGYAEGRFSVQDEGSQLIARALGACSGERVVDACSGRGGKTLVLADAVGPEGKVLAMDVAEAKLAQLPREMQRLGIEDARIERYAVDLSVGLGGLPEASFDRVLVDAPCSGMGTLGRRPELALRLMATDPGRIAELQQAIVERAIRLVKPGGRLVYAVCSIASIEMRALRPALTGEAKSLALETVDLPIAPDDDGMYRVGPWNVGHAMDAYQFAVTRRV